MNGQSTEDRGSNADRRIGEWADLSARSRPPAAGPEILRARVEVAAVEQRRSRRSVPGLAMVLVVALVVAGVGFGLSRQQSAVAPSAVAPSASPSAVVSPTASPGPSASPSPQISLPGDDVLDIGRIDARSGWASVLSPESSNLGVPMLLMTDDGGRAGGTPRRRNKRTFSRSSSSSTPITAGSSKPTARSGGRPTAAGAGRKPLCRPAGRARARP